MVDNDDDDDDWGVVLGKCFDCWAWLVSIILLPIVVIVFVPVADHGRVTKAEHPLAGTRNNQTQVATKVPTA